MMPTCARFPVRLSKSTVSVPLADGAALVWLVDQVQWFTSCPVTLTRWVGFYFAWAGAAATASTDGEDERDAHQRIQRSSPTHVNRDGV